MMIVGGVRAFRSLTDPNAPHMQWKFPPYERHGSPTSPQQSGLPATEGPIAAD